MEDDMQTKLLAETPEDLSYAAELIAGGQVVGFPTETVYGLGADACNPEAVRRIFTAKERPADNPLIVHISDMDMLSQAAASIPEPAFRLAERFWPGPLTMIFKKQPWIPAETSGGLDTVGVRLPDHETARAFIRACGKLIAAPSANRSGKPSPTTAEHVLEDMKGRIPAIIDGGVCRCGVESTVISFETDGTPRILRPGFVTKEMLAVVTGNVLLDEALFRALKPDEQAASPGMKYKHYAPKAEVLTIDGSFENFCAYLEKHQGDGVFAMISNSESKCFPYPHLAFGDTPEEHCQLLFSRLRDADAVGAKTVYVRMPKPDGVGLAACNRLLRASAFRIIRV